MTATAVAIANTPMVQIRRMWEGGPLRLWSASANSKCPILYSAAISGFVGAYVCDQCLEPSGGVYQSHDKEQKWLCGACQRESLNETKRKNHMRQNPSVAQ